MVYADIGTGCGMGREIALVMSCEARTIGLDVIACVLGTAIVRRANASLFVVARRFGEGSAGTVNRS